MNIDWNSIAEDASNSPRGILAEWLAQADDIVALALIIECKRGDGTAWTYALTGGNLHCLGLIDAAHESVRQEVQGDA